MPRKKEPAINFEADLRKTCDEIALVFLSVFRALVNYSTGIHLKADPRIKEAPALDQTVAGWDESLALRVYIFVLRELYVLLPDRKQTWVDREVKKLEEDIALTLRNKATRDAEVAWAKVAKTLAEEVMK